MSVNANFASTPLVGAALLTTGDTSRTAPTVSSTLITAGGSGSQVERITVMPVATTTATVVRIFRYDGTTFHLYAEVPIAAQTLAGGTPVIPQTMEAVNNPNLFPFLLPSGWSVKVSINDTQTGVKVLADAGSF